MADEGQPRSGFYADAESGVCYRNLDFMGFIGYRVGDDGSVWSCRKQRRVSGHRGSVGYVSSEWRRLRPNPNDRGYLSARLYSLGKLFLYRIARLVLTAFTGPCLENLEACHFPDRTVSNNRLGNVRWDTKANNVADTYKHGTATVGERNGRAKLADEKIASMRDDRKLGMSFSQLGEKYGVTACYAGKVIRGLNRSKSYG